MRDSRTPHENIAIAGVRNTLISQGHSIEDDLSITDKPDWVFIKSNSRVACECSILVPEKIMEWSHTKTRHKLDEQWITTYAYEPHSWVKKIIEKKRTMVTEYKKRANADKCWLLVHTPDEKNHSTLIFDDISMHLLSYGASSIGHAFDQIWVSIWGKGAHRIWRKGQNTRKPSIDFSNGYPTRSWKTSTSKVTTDENGNWNGSINWDEIPISGRSNLEPIDPEYKKYLPKNT